MLSCWLCKHFFNWQAPVQMVLAAVLLRWASAAEAPLVVVGLSRSGGDALV
jgi:hypothetical protein